LCSLPSTISSGFFLDTFQLISCAETVNVNLGLLSSKISPLTRFASVQKRSSLNFGSHPSFSLLINSVLMTANAASPQHF